MIMGLRDIDMDTALRSSCLGVARGDLGGASTAVASKRGFGFSLGGG